MGFRAPSRVRIPPSPCPCRPDPQRTTREAGLDWDPAAPVAQLDRASVYGTEGQRFESSRARSPEALHARGFRRSGRGVKARRSGLGSTNGSTRRRARATPTLLTHGHCRHSLDADGRSRSGSPVLRFRLSQPSLSAADLDHAELSPAARRAILEAATGPTRLRVRVPTPPSRPTPSCASRRSVASSTGPHETRPARKTRYCGARGAGPSRERLRRGRARSPQDRRRPSRAGRRSRRRAGDRGRLALWRSAVRLARWLRGRSDVRVPVGRRAR
jgi:hypothetical protein